MKRPGFWSARFTASTRQIALDQTPGRQRALTTDEGQLGSSQYSIGVKIGHIKVVHGCSSPGQDWVWESISSKPHCALAQPELLRTCGDFGTSLHLDPCASKAVQSSCISSCIQPWPSGQFAAITSTPRDYKAHHGDLVCRCEKRLALLLCSLDTSQRVAIT